jgi:YVTN family beta-propeller protein
MPGWGRGRSPWVSGLTLGSGVAAADDGNSNGSASSASASSDNTSGTKGPKRTLSKISSHLDGSSHTGTNTKKQPATSAVTANADQPTDSEATTKPARLVKTAAARLSNAKTGVSAISASSTSRAGGVVSNAQALPAAESAAANSGGDYATVETINLGTTATNVAISGSGGRSYVVTGGGQVRILDTSGSTPVVTDTVTVGKSPFDVAANSDGTRAFVTNSGDNTVSIIEKALTGGAAPKVTSVAVGTDPTGVAVNSSGTRAYVSNTGSNTVSIIDYSAPRPLSIFNNSSGTPKVTSVAVGPAPTSIATNADGTIAYVTNSGGNNVSIIRYNGAGTPTVANVPVTASPRSVKVSGSGTKAVVYSDGGIISIIDAGSATPTVTVVPGRRSLPRSC